MTTRRSLIGALGLGTVIALGPAVALAVSANNVDGNGSESVRTWYSNGARLTGNLRSNTGKAVYFQAKINFNLVGSTGWERLTGDTKSASYVSRDDTMTYLDSAQSPKSVDVKVCTNKPAAKDPCGSSKRINR